jgi:hypothetical protein
MGHFEYFRKFADIFASQDFAPLLTTQVANLPPVKTTPALNFATGGAPRAANTSANFRKI